MKCRLTSRSESGDRGKNGISQWPSCEFRPRACMHMRGGNPQLISGSPIWPSNVLDRLRKVRISEKHVSRVESIKKRNKRKKM
jgi:hypothetical protein